MTSLATAKGVVLKHVSLTKYQCAFCIRFRLSSAQALCEENLASASLCWNSASAAAPLFQLPLLLLGTSLTVRPDLSYRVASAGHM